MKIFLRGNPIKGRLATWSGVGLLGVALLIIAPGLLRTPAVAGQVTPTTRSGRDIVLVLRADKAAYRVGEVIRLEVALENRGPSDVLINVASPWHAGHLIIVDSRGNRVAQIRDADVSDYPSTRGVIIGAGKTLVLPWAGVVWNDLGRWGYQLLEPGTYKITGIPWVTGNSMTPDFTTVRSNVVTISIK